MNHEGFQLVSKYSNQAQNRAPEKTWEGGVFSGSFDGADAYSLFVGYHFTKHLSSELIATQTLSNFVESNLVGMQIIHTSLPNKKWRPMMILGAGKIYISPKSTLVLPENRDNDFMKVGIGIKTHFVRGFYFRAEYNAYRQLTQREENVTNDEWKLGFSTLF